MAAHAWGGVHETRERSQRAESDRCVEKYIGVFCGYTLVSGLSRGYTRICGQGVAHAAVGFACRARCEKGTALVVARRLDFVGRARPTHVFERPAEALARGGGVAGRWQQQQHAASVEQALAKGWRCAGRCAWPGREVGRRGALCEPICRLRGRGFVCWCRPRAGRPGLSGRGMRRASRRTHHSLYRYGFFFLIIILIAPL